MKLKSLHEQNAKAMVARPAIRQRFQDLHMVDIRRDYPYHDTVEVSFGDPATVVMACYNDDFIALTAFWSGTFEPGSLALWVELALQGSPLILDIGSYSGLYGLLAATVWPKSKVWSFEAIPRVYDRLCLNKNLNGTANLRTINKAVGSHLSTATFQTRRGEHVLPTGSKFASASPAEAEMVAIQVPVVSVDEQLAEMPDAPACRLLKIDVEGAEMCVLQGAEHLLRQSRPNLLIEVLTPESLEQVQGFLAPLGYQRVQIDESNHRYNRNEPVEHDDNLNFLFSCAPAEKLETLLDKAQSRWRETTARRLSQEF